MKFKQVIIYVILLFIVNILYGQNLKFVHYTPEEENGISNGTVRKIIQDKQGIIWIGTEDGINKFDGYTFRKFKYNPDDTNTVSDNKIYDILEDHDGKLWFATGFGLNKYDPKFNRFIRYLNIENNDNSLSDNSVRCIVEDNEMVLWIGTDNGGLNTLNINTGVFYNYNNRKDSSSLNVEIITALFKSNDGNIWIGTKNNGLFKYDQKANDFKQYLFTHNNEEYQEMKNWITCIYEDNNGNLWIGTRKGGLNLMDKKNNILIDYTKLLDISEPKELDKYWIRSIIEDKHGQVWVATKNGLTKIELNKQCLGFYEMHNDNNAYSINCNNLTDLFLDASGSLWIGSYDLGFDIVHHTIVNFSHHKKVEDDDNTIRSNIVFVIEEDEYGGLLICTTAGGISLLDRRTNRMTHYADKNSELDKPVLDIHLDKTGTLWLGTWGKGLQYFDRKTGFVKSYIAKSEDSTSISNNTVMSVYDDNKGNLWLATFNGMDRFDKKTTKFKRFYENDGLPCKIINYITGNGQDTLWIGTRGGGLSIYNTKTQKFENYLFVEGDSTSISNNVVNYIYNDKKGHLWLSTDAGLNCFIKKTKKIIRITEKDGLPHNRLWGIFEDKEGNLWISSNYGICRYTPDFTNSTKGKFRNFNKSDGLQGNEFTQLAHFQNNKTGEIFFGGVNGFNSFFPDRIIENKYIPPVHLISFKKMDEEVVFKGDTTVNYKKDIQVSWRENFIAFEFAGLDYADPEKNLYSYKMEGLDINWSNPSVRRYAPYPNIRDGEYIFRVRAANNEGIWNNEGLAVRVTINPPFWRTNWFIISSVIATILAILLYIRIRTKRLKQEKRILEETVAQRTAELRQKNEDILSSIQYAKRIQVAILPTLSAFKKEFPNSFIVYKPKDIVSGDFFWFYKKGKRRLFAAADCTGHGVPGAFMSIIGNNLLEKIVNDKNILDPAELLTELDADIIEALDQRGRKGDSFDGMDIALCAHEKGSNVLEYAGAYRPLIHISGREVTKVRSTKRSIGGSQKIEKKDFVTNRIEVKKGDIVYAFSDGYADQFGGPKGRKFMMRNLQEELANIHHIPINEQADYMNETIEIWMNNYNLKYEQVDDILLIGVQF